MAALIVLCVFFAFTVWYCVVFRKRWKQVATILDRESQQQFVNVKCYLNGKVEPDDSLGVWDKINGGAGPR